MPNNMAELLEIAEDSKVNIVFNVGFTLLGARLNAAFQKLEETVYLVLAPSSSQQARLLSLSEMIQSATTFFNDTGNDLPGELSEDALAGSLSEIGGGNIADRVKFQLKMAYILVKMGAGKKQMEFAFDLEIVADPPIGLGELIKFESISFAVWNVNKAHILDAMHIKDVYALLTESTQPQNAIPENL